VFDYWPGEARFLDVLLHTQKYMWNYSLDFFSDLLGLRKFPPWKRLIFGPEIGPPSNHADVFTAVLKKFPELSNKIIYVIGPDDFVDLLALRNTQTNVIPLKLQASIYVLDMHPNKEGHQQIADGILEVLLHSEKGERCLYKHSRDGS